MTPHLAFTSIVETVAAINAIIQCKQALFVRLIRENAAILFSQCGSLARCNASFSLPASVSRQKFACQSPLWSSCTRPLCYDTPGRAQFGNACDDLNFQCDQWIWTGVPNEGQKAKWVCCDRPDWYDRGRYEWMTMRGFRGVSVLIKCLHTRNGMTTNKCKLPSQAGCCFLSLTLM